MNIRAEKFSDVASESSFDKFAISSLHLESSLYSHFYNLDMVRHNYFWMSVTKGGLGMVNMLTVNLFAQMFYNIFKWIFVYKKRFQHFWFSWIFVKLFTIHFFIYIFSSRQKASRRDFNAVWQPTSRKLKKIENWRGEILQIETHQIFEAIDWMKRARVLFKGTKFHHYASGVGIHISDMNEAKLSFTPRHAFVTHLIASAYCQGSVRLKTGASGAVNTCKKISSKSC